MQVAVFSLYRIPFLAWKSHELDSIVILLSVYLINCKLILSLIFQTSEYFALEISHLCARNWFQ